MSEEKPYIAMEIFRKDTPFKKFSVISVVRYDTTATRKGHGHMKTVWSTIAVMFLAVFLATPGMTAEGIQNKPGGTVMKATTITATVESIDYETRYITLKGLKGGSMTFIAGDEVRNLKQVKKGDIVTFDYAESVAVDVQKSSEAPKMAETRSVTRSKVGEKPAGSVETVGFLTAGVQEINYATRAVKLALPEGQTLDIIAGSQVKRLNEVKKGDEVVVQYVQKLSITVTSPK